MKLNPPETAPRNVGTIMVCLHGLNLYPAVWNDRQEVWLVVHGTAEGYFNIRPVSHHSVTGWLPIPRISAKGNLI